MQIRCCCSSIFFLIEASDFELKGFFFFQLEDQMKDNVSVIKTNCDSLDSRIKAVQK